MSGWLSRHISTAVGSLGRLVRQPFASLMIILVIAVTLAIPASLNLVVKNAQSVSAGWDNALDFSVYLQHDIDEEAANNLANLIAQRADVESVSLITAADALEEFREQSGFGEALDQLSENPLPHTLVVRPGAANTSQTIVLLQEELSNLPEADTVQVDTGVGAAIPRHPRHSSTRHRHRRSTAWCGHRHHHRQHHSPRYPESSRGN